MQDRYRNRYERETYASSRFRDKMLEIRGILKDIKDGNDFIDNNTQRLREMLSAFINTARAGHKEHEEIIVSVTDILNTVMDINKSKTGDPIFYDENAEDNEILNIPESSWRQVLTEFYNQGYIRIIPILVEQTLIMSIVLVKSVNIIQFKNGGCGKENNQRLTYAKRTAMFDKIIIDYISCNPELPQGQIVVNLKEKMGVCRSTIAAHIRRLRKTGKLPFWQNPPMRDTKVQENIPV